MTCLIKTPPESIVQTLYDLRAQLDLLDIAKQIDVHPDTIRKWYRQETKPTRYHWHKLLEVHKQFLET